MFLFILNLAEKVASHYVPSDSKEAPIFDSCVETDEQTEKAPKTSKEVLPVDLDAKVSAETPLVGPLEDANLGMSSGRLDNAAAAKEDSPMISALAAENDPVEDAATHGRSTNFFILMTLLKIQPLKESIPLSCRNMSIISQQFPSRTLWNRRSRMVCRRWNRVGMSLTIPCQSWKLDNYWKHRSPMSRS